VKRTALRFLGLAGVTLLVAATAAPDEPAPKPEPGQTAARKTPAEKPPVYRPPTRGKPRARIAGGVRGVAQRLPSLQTLVPDHTGQTISEQPSLFWYLDGPVPEQASLVFTLTDSERIDPLVEAEIAHPGGPGIQRIELARYPVKLVPGTEYQWSVVLIVDAEQRSKDVVSVGWIDRIEPPAGLGLDPRSPGSARAYAEQGLWYDALAAASDSLEADPDDPTRRARRNALLRQVGLAMALPAP
jgi:hypothetical protein